MKKGELNKLREQIDAIDGRILELLNERYRIVQEVGRWKSRNKHHIYVPEREKKLFSRLEKINNGPVSKDAMQAIFREIISGAIALEKPLTISFLGPRASFTHLAALNSFGHAAEYLPKSNIGDIFQDVETERADYGVVPVENSTEGAVNHTLDMFVNSTVKICAETNLHIHHNLLAKKKNCEIRRIYSHAQVFGQCRAWIQENYPGIETVELSSTAKAAERAAKEDNSAAVASSLAAELYKLHTIRQHIEDSAENMTRFLVISRQEPHPTGDDKTSICYAIKDRVGALYETLLPFKENKITLTMIESRPSRKRNWEYCFFVDLLGHVSEEKIRSSLESLKEHCQFVRVLGSYPRSGGAGE